MAIIVQSTSTATASNATEVVVTKPSGVQTGDLLLLIATGSGASTYPTCTGFTQIQTSSVSGGISTCIAMLYRIADASDVSASNYTVGLVGTTNSGAATMLRVSGWVSGNPIYASATATDSQDSASYTITSSTLSLARPTQQLLIVAGIHRSEDHYADFSNVTMTSGHSNPSWVAAATNQDFETGSGADFSTFFVYYANPTITSTITQYSIDVASSITGGNDVTATFLAVICSPQNQTGTHTLHSADADFFAPTPEVGTSGTNNLLEVDAEFFDASGKVTNTTNWTNETQPTTTWVNETV